MYLAAFLAVVLILIYLIYKADEPRREYYAKHVEPLEKTLDEVRDRRNKESAARDSALANASLFTRDLNGECKAQQSKKDAAYKDLETLKEAKSRCHENQKAVRQKLDAWHRGSRSYFGNKARKIPEDSFLGMLGLEQTIAQKEALERRRASISNGIAELKSRMDEIYKTRITPAKEALERLQKDRTRLHEFRREGLSQAHFRKVANQHDAEVKRLEDEMAGIKREIEAAKTRFETRASS